MTQKKVASDSTARKKAKKGTPDLAKIDKAMAVQKQVKDGVSWYDAAKKPMLLAGFNWFARDHVFERLPVKKPAFVTQYPNGKKTQVAASDCGAFLLAPNDAGGRVYFRTNSKRVFLRYELIHQNVMDHMPYTGSAGFDLYCRTQKNGPWGLSGVTRVCSDQKAFDSLPLNGLLPGKMCDCILHFPLYNGVKYLSIGVEEGASVEAFYPWSDDRKIVLYGTSITQGGCASRPGMASSNMLARDLGMDVLNFGFSGSGKGEPEIAKMLIQVPNPAIFMLDYDWNIHSSEEMAATLSGFLDILRKKYPTVPILVISRSPSARNFCAPDCEECQIANGKKQVQMAEVARRKKAGDKRIFFLDGGTLLGKDFSECCVDGCHMTDLGFLRWTKSVEKILPKLLKLK